MAATEKYLDLVRRLPLRPIRDEAGLDAAAIAMIDTLLALEAPSPEESDYLDVLGDLVESYEDRAHPIPEASPVEVLRHLMECREMSQADLARDVGIPVSVVSEVLAGRRGMSKAVIARLAGFFRVSADVFF